MNIKAVVLYILYVLNRDAVVCVFAAVVVVEGLQLVFCCVVSFLQDCTVCSSFVFCYVFSVVGLCVLCSVVCCVWSGLGLAGVQRGCPVNVLLTGNKPVAGNKPC